MLKGYSWLKNLLLLVLLLLAIVYALPNLFGEDYAVQVSPREIANFNNQAAGELEQRLNDAFAQHSVVVKELSIDKTGILVRLFNSEAQLKAQKVVKDLLSSEYIVALNLAPATPKIFASIGAKPMKLGLDLRGGVHFLLEVDSDTLLKRHMEGHLVDVKNELRTAKIHYLTIKSAENSIGFSFTTSAQRDEALGVLSNKLGHFELTKGEFHTDSGVLNYSLDLMLRENYITEIKASAIEQSINTLRNRINELGVAEAIVQRQGMDRIVVELPGVQDTARAKEILGKTATIEFRLVVNDYPLELGIFDNPPAGTKAIHVRDGGKMIVSKKVVLSGDSIVGANPGTDQYDKPAVNLVVSGSEVNHFKKITKDNIGNRMALVYVETKIDDVLVNGELTKYKSVTETILSAPTIQSGLGNKFMITGFSKQEAQNLSLYLRAGALPAAITIIEERTVGPSMGQENIDLGLLSVKVGLGLVFVFMAAYYGVFGLIANLTLIINLIFLVALLSIIGATLTLPGIAGMVLTVGMAVDANVLIFERIREELRHKVAPWLSISRGFDRAFATIIDSNLTTLIVGIILFSIGVGPVKGFAVTLCLGILTSMLTAIMGSRAIINLIYAGKSKLTKLPIGIEFFKITNIDFMGIRKGTAIISILMIVLSSVALFTRGINFGLDFTGGTQLELRYSKPVNLNSIRTKLEAAGYHEAKVLNYGTEHDVLIRLANKAGVTEQELSKKIVTALNEGSNMELRKVEFVGAEVGDELVEQGFIALAAALAGILIYIAFRFEYRFGISAVLALLHDPIVILGVFSFLQLEFDMATLAGILAVVGYSLNDTIVVYDRVREELYSHKKLSTKEILNLAINQTLSRTIMTSLCTLLVVTALLVFGGDSLSGFSTALFVGIIVGTYSSIYVAGALAMVFGLKRESLINVPVKNEDEIP